jgi:hypothetical protein
MFTNTKIALSFATGILTLIGLFAISAVVMNISVESSVPCPRAVRSAISSTQSLVLLFSPSDAVHAPYCGSVIIGP